MQFFLNGREARLDDFISDDLARAVVNSLFSWRRAADSDGVSSGRREGWWADSYAEGGDMFGSRLWLLQREKLTNETLLKAKEYAEEALRWLIDDAVAGAVDVSVERAGVERMDLSVIVRKPDLSTLDLRFQHVWEK